MNHADGSPLVEFIEVMHQLRQRCPWKAEQTHRSLARHLLEETHEAIEAIEAGEPGHLCEELGDVLLQVYFHAEIASEAGQFTIDDVARGLTEKMRRRNPHVFGPADSALSATEVNDQWQQLKAAEKARTSITDGLPPGLPALLHADKVLDRLQRVDAEPDPTAAPAPSAGIGDRLLDLVREARADGIDPEQALRDAIRRVVAAHDGSDLPDDEGGRPAR